MPTLRRKKKDTTFPQKLQDLIFGSSSMASIFREVGLFMVLVSTSVSLTLSASVIEDLKNLKPPVDFNSTITTNCLNNPSLRYCNFSPMDLDEIFKFTIVGSHLCNESKNPNCVESFPKIDLRNRPVIAPLYLSFSFFWKYCPLSVLSIDLSNNSLKGSFPIDVFQCTQIRDLDLSHNQLSGEFPVQSFSPMTNLTILNVSYNHFSEISQASDTEFFTRFESSSFLHSGLIPDHESFRVKLMVFLVGFPILVIMVIGFLGWVCLHRPDFLPKMLQRKHLFTASMLKAATDGFSEECLVGKSEAIDIYCGTLRDGTEVRIEVYRDEASREIRSKFVEECKVLVQLRHKNIVQVLGWCDNRRFRAVVSEWTEGQNVETWLLGSNPPWKHRLRLMKGVISGMCYFSEIYKLGVFLLEIIANSRPQNEFEGKEAGFVKFVRTHYPADLQKVIDENMKLTENVFDQAKQVIELGLMCTDQSSNRQLNLRQIFDIISKAYESFTFVTSPYQKRSDGNRGKGHR